MARRKSETIEEYRARNREDARKAYQRDPQKFRDRAQQRRDANPQRAAEIDRRHHLKTTYGITPEEYDKILLRQGGSCAVCKGDRCGPGKFFHVDHCHKTNRVRGLLCSRCNTALGLLRDESSLIAALLEYLQKEEEK